MPVSPVLNRADFESLYLFAGAEKGSLNPILSSRIVKQYYPKTIRLAAEELEVRGLQVDQARLAYFVRKGKVQPNKVAGEHVFTASEIDRIAALATELQYFTPDAWMRLWLGLNAADEVRALLKAQTEWPDVNQFVRIVVPGDASLGISASIVFRPMTAGEIAEREVRRKEARHNARQSAVA